MMNNSGNKSYPDKEHGVGLFIAELREQYNLTQKDLARKLGTKQQYISRIEKSNTPITTKTLQKIAKIFHKELVIRFK